MNSSDIIAVVAIIVSAIVSIVASVLSARNSKANIEAKRSELALEKRMEAFSKVLGEMGKVTT